MKRQATTIIKLFTEWCKRTHVEVDKLTVAEVAIIAEAFVHHEDVSTVLDRMYWAIADSEVERSRQRPGHGDMGG